MGGKKKQKKTDGDVGTAGNASGSDAAPTTSGRNSTISIAVAGSTVEHAQSIEAAVAIAGQIARAAVIFNVEEIVVYDDTPGSLDQKGKTVSASAAFLARVLQYLDTPPYLRSELMPGNKPEYQAADKLPPLLAPHHIRGKEWKPYREGIVKTSEAGQGSFVDVGLDRNVFVEGELPLGMRVTVHLGLQPQTKFMPQFSETMMVGEVSPGTVQVDTCTMKYMLMTSPAPARQWRLHGGA